MSRDDVRARLERAWLEADRDAAARKDSHSTVFALEAFYRSLHDADLRAAEDVLIEWAQAADERRRFDALALIDSFAIVAALPILRRLASEYEHSPAPSAPYDWAKVNRIIGRLASSRSEGG